jgi:HEAT repeat protein
MGMFAFSSPQAVLRDPHPEVRDHASRALSGLARVKGGYRLEGETAERAATRPRAARSALFAALKDPDEQIRTGAALALGYVGAEIAPDLIAGLGDASPLVRLNVVRAVAIDYRNASAALPALRSRRSDPDPDVRGAVVATIKTTLKGDP